MSNLDFIELAYEHWEALLFCISFSFICYILIFKSWYISILDPFVLSAVLSACGFGVVIFPFLCNAIQLKYFVRKFFGGFYIDACGARGNFQISACRPVPILVFSADFGFHAAVNQLGIFVKSGLQPCFCFQRDFGHV